MGAIGNTYPTLVEVTKRLDPDGAIADVAQTLSQSNPILDDVPFIEGNLPTGHRYTSQTALPSLSWRKFNQGVDPTAGVSDQYDETCGMLEAYSKVDVDLAKLNGNEAAFRASEDENFITAFNIEIATGLFYHSVKNTPEKFQGLTPRLDVTSGNPAAAQIVKWGGSASGNDQTSVWLVGWSPKTVFAVYPKGSMAGLDSRDLGQQLVLDSNSKQFLAYVTRYQWKIGLVVRDYRYVVRGCNIDTSAATNTDGYIINQMMDMLAAMYELNSVRPVFYMNRWAFSHLNKNLMAKQANLLEWIDGSESGGRAGKRIPAFLGVPITIVDAITKTESVVS